MANRNQIERYVKKLKKEFQKYLISGVSISINCLYAKDGGGVLKINLNNNSLDDVTYDGRFETTGEAVSSSGQHALGGDLKHVNFGGTSKVIEGNTIYIIKSSDGKEWGNEKVVHDVKDIVSGGGK